MHDYPSNITLPDAALLVLQSKRVVVTTHAKPDGDAFGAVVALSTALRNLGLDTQAFFMPPVPADFRQLRGGDTVRLLPPGEKLPDADLFVVLDTGAWSQLSPIRDELTPRLGKTLILDHHLSGDVAAAHRYVDGQSGSSCEIVAGLLDAMAAALPDAASKEKLYDATVAEAIFVGLASDTGWFRFSNTTPRSHELAARLQRLGVDHADLYRKLEQTNRAEKLMLLIRALASLKFIAAGRAAMMVLRREDFTQTGALVEETERFVDVPQAVAGVDVVVLITEPPAAPGNANGTIRVSFRSKPGPQAVDVNAMARRFGGGGHARAAGAKIDGSLEDVVKRVATAVDEALKRQ